MADESYITAEDDPFLALLGASRDAIAGIESRGSGDYSAIGPKTRSGDRAYGRYQVMGSNIPSWTRKYLGKELSAEEFLASPEAQDAVFNGEFGSYIKRYGNPQDAASAWFTGGPLASNATKRDSLGTSGNEYVNKFNKLIGAEKEGELDESRMFTSPLASASFLDPLSLTFPGINLLQNAYPKPTPAWPVLESYNLKPFELGQEQYIDHGGKRLRLTPVEINPFEV